MAGNAEKSGRWSRAAPVRSHAIHPENIQPLVRTRRWVASPSPRLGQALEQSRHRTTGETLRFSATSNSKNPRE